MANDPRGLGRRWAVAAFMKGFVMGVASPALILTATLSKPVAPVEEGLRDGWRQIGADMSAVLRRFGRGDAGKTS